MKKCLMTLLALAALAGCKNDSPPRWRQACVDRDYTTTIIPVWNGTSMTMQPVTTSHCVRYEMQCRPAGRDYTGPLTCENMEKPL
jgi:heat shock protein HslJ